MHCSRDIDLDSVISGENINNLHKIMVKSDNVGWYRERIGVRLVSTNKKVGYQKYYKLLIDASCQFEMTALIVVTYDRDITSIITNNYYEPLNVPKEGLATLCRVSNNLIAASDGSLFGEFFLDNGNVVHTHRIDLGPQVSSMAYDLFYHGISNIVNACIKSSLVFSGLFAPGANPDDLCNKYPMNMSKEDLVCVVDMLKQ